jgi:hypothetical protein
MRQGARLRGDNLIIVSDCTSSQIQVRQGAAHEVAQAELKQTDHNYLTEILPGDWVLAWIVNDETTFLDLLKRIKAANPDEALQRLQRRPEVPGPHRQRPQAHAPRPPVRLQDVGHDARPPSASASWTARSSTTTTWPRTT